MSLTKRVLRKLQLSLPETRVCKKFLVISPTEHIMRGFLFDRSIMPGMFYFWSFIAPVYVLRPSAILNYGDRLEKGETFHITEDTVDAVSDRILRAITNGPLDHLRKVNDPKSFLSHLNDLLPGRRSKLDLALTHYMLGHEEECIRFLEDDVERLRPHVSKAKWIGEPIKFLAELREDPEAAARRVKSWEHENITNWGLAKAMGEIA